MDYAMHPDLVARAPANQRAVFIRRTYAHLAGAILAFTGLEMLLFKTGAAEDVVRTIEREKVMTVTVVGDAIARPLIAAIERGVADV